MSLWMKGLTGGAAVLFASWAYFQLNDPDVLLWVVIYAGTALLCGWALFRPIPAVIPLVFGAVALVWALWVAVDVALSEGFAFVFEHFVEDEGERAREILGLLVDAAWNGFFAGYMRRLRTASPA